MFFNISLTCSIYLLNIISEVLMFFNISLTCSIHLLNIISDESSPVMLVSEITYMQVCQKSLKFNVPV